MCNEYRYTINLKSNGTSARGLPKKLRDHAIKRQVTPFSRSSDPSVSLHSLVNMNDSEDITFEKSKIQEFSIRINTITDSLDTFNIKDPSRPSVPQNHQKEPNKHTKLLFKKFSTFCHKSNHSVSICFRRLNSSKDHPKQSNSPTPTFINTLDVLVLIQITAIVKDYAVEAKVIIIEFLPQILDSKWVNILDLEKEIGVGIVRVIINFQTPTVSILRLDMTNIINIKIHIKKTISLS